MEEGSEREEGLEKGLEGRRKGSSRVGKALVDRREASPSSSRTLGSSSSSTLASADPRDSVGSRVSGREDGASRDRRRRRSTRVRSSISTTSVKAGWDQVISRATTFVRTLKVRIHSSLFCRLRG